MRNRYISVLTALAVAAVTTTSPAHARYYGYGAGVLGGIAVGAIIAGIASNTYRYERGYGYYGGYYPVYGRRYPPRYYGDSYGYSYGYSYGSPFYGYDTRGYNPGDNIMDRYPN